MGEDYIPVPFISILLVVVIIATAEINRVSVSECDGANSYSYNSLYGIRTKRTKVDNDPRCVLALDGHNYNINLKGEKL